MFAFARQYRELMCAVAEYLSLRDRAHFAAAAKCVRGAIVHAPVYDAVRWRASIASTLHVMADTWTDMGIIDVIDIANETSARVMHTRTTFYTCCVHTRALTIRGISTCMHGRYTVYYPDEPINGNIAYPALYSVNGSVYSDLLAILHNDTSTQRHPVLAKKYV